MRRKCFDERKRTYEKEKIYSRYAINYSAVLNWKELA